MGMMASQNTSLTIVYLTMYSGADERKHQSSVSLAFVRGIHNGHDGVSNHQPHDCLLNHVFRHRWKKTSKLRVTGLCEGNSLVTSEFPTRRASNAENVSIWWHVVAQGKCANRHLKLHFMKWFPGIDPSHKSHNASGKYLTMLNFATEIIGPRRF